MGLGLSLAAFDVFPFLLTNYIIGCLPVHSHAYIHPIQASSSILCRKMHSGTCLFELNGLLNFLCKLNDYVGSSLAVRHQQLMSAKSVPPRFQQGLRVQVLDPVHTLFGSCMSLFLARCCFRVAIDGCPWLRI